jgi:hypothetical protein
MLQIPRSITGQCGSFRVSQKPEQRTMRRLSRRSSTCQTTSFQVRPNFRFTRSSHGLPRAHSSRFDSHLSHNGLGSHVSPLSLLPFGDAPFDAQHLKPYDPKVHLRHSISISAIPFSISPFDVIELARDSAPPRVRLTTKDRGGNEFWVSAKHDIRELIVSASDHFDGYRFRSAN